MTANKDYSEIEQEFADLKTEMLNTLQQIERDVLRDPISGLGVTYDVQTDSFNFKTFQIITNSVTIDAEIPLNNKDEYGLEIPSEERRTYSEGALTVELIATLIGNLATFVVFRFSCNKKVEKLLIDLVNSSEITTSKVFLIDQKSGEYYYPLSTNVAGRVVSDYPNVGIIAFQPFRKTPGTCFINFADLDIGNDCKSSIFKFELKSTIPEGIIEEDKWHNGFTTLKEDALKKLNAEEEKITSKKAIVPGCCSIVVLILIVIFIIGMFTK